MNTLREPQETTPVESLHEFIASFDWWYQRIYLGQGVYTIPGENPAHHEIVWQAVSPCLCPKLEGKSFLDIGTNAGYFALQAKQAGAQRVVGIDLEAVYLEQASRIASIWNVDINYRQMDAHEMASLGEQFDVVCFAGTLYHLKNPFAAIEAVGRLCRDTVIIETECIPPSDDNRVSLRLGQPGEVKRTTVTSGFMKFIESTELNGDPTNWWVPDTECLKAMFRAAGFRRFSHCYYPSEGRIVLLASKSSLSSFDLSAFIAGQSTVAQTQETFSQDSQRLSVLRRIKAKTARLFS